MVYFRNQCKNGTISTPIQIHSDNSKLILEDSKAVFQKLTFSTVYAMEDPEDKLDIFNNLVTECIHRNAPLK